MQVKDKDNIKREKKQRSHKSELRAQKFYMCERGVNKLSLLQVHKAAKKKNYSTLLPAKSKTNRRCFNPSHSRMQQENAADDSNGRHKTDPK